MKKIALLLSGVFVCTVAMAQISLTGTSYSQNFDGIAAGLPQGWELYTAGTAISLGNNVSSTNFVAAHTRWSTTTGNFRNCASADNFAAYYLGDTTSQANATDRALSLRQVSNTSTTFPGSDFAAFTFHISNTNGLQSFSGSFKLQSLDSTSPRVVTWQLEYATGAAPSSFSALSTVTGTMTTGGNTYTNNTITFNFGNVLNNISSDVWIRIIPTGPSTGSGNRPTTGIDDFNLNWTGSGAPNYHPNIISLTPSDNSTNIPSSTNSLQITFDRQVMIGTGSIVVKNETDQTNQIFTLPSANVTVNGYVATISNITLAQGKTYHVTFDSTAFDTAGFRGVGIYDTTTWNFSTSPGVATSLNENFDASCPAGLPAGWSKYSVTGSQQWNCTNFGYNSTPAFTMNGYFNQVNYVNEDWLITPQLNLIAIPNPAIQFRAFKKFAGDDIKLLVSNNYDGTSDPTNAGFTWNDLNINFTTVDTNWNIFSGFLNNYKNTPMHIAFKYTSSATDGAQWKIDNVEAKSFIMSVANTNKSSLTLTVLGNSTNTEMTLRFGVKEGKYDLTIYDLAGRKMYSEQIQLLIGMQRKTIDGFHLSNGMYIVKITDGKEFGAVKFIVE